MSVLIVEVTSKCNLKCDFCYNIWHQDGVNVPSVFGLEKLKEDTRFLVESLGVKSLCCSGGEPLLWEHLDEYISFCRVSFPFLDIGIITNGILLTENRLLGLLDKGLSYVELSLFASDNIEYQKIAKVDKFDIVLDNIYGIKLTGIPLRIAITITKDSSKYLEKLLSLSFGTSADFIAINPFVPAGRGIKSKALKKEDLALSLKIADEFVSKNHIKIQVTIPIDEGFKKDYPNLQFSKCECGTNKFTLSSDSDLYICEHRKNKINFENLSHDDVKKAIELEFEKMPCYKTGWC